MACFYCNECDRLLDGDWVVCEEWGDDLICLDCHVELTPENWEDYILERSNLFKVWTLTHRDYDGAPIHSFEGPADARFFLGDTLEDVWAQAKEYEEENANA